VKINILESIKIFFSFIKLIWHQCDTSVQCATTTSLQIVPTASLTQGQGPVGGLDVLVYDSKSLNIDGSIVRLCTNN